MSISQSKVIHPAWSMFHTHAGFQGWYPDVSSQPVSRLETPPLQLCLSPLLLPKPLLLGDGYFLLPLQLYAQFHPCLLVILRPCCLGPLHQ